MFRGFEDGSQRKSAIVAMQRLVHKGELSLILVKLIHRLRLALSNNTFLVGPYMGASRITSGLLRVMKQEAGLQSYIRPFVQADEARWP